MKTKKLAFLVIAVMLSIGLVTALVTSDFLQLGDASNEVIHTVTGFGPIEPDTHGGNWGGMGSSLEPSPSDNKCRVTWSWDEDDTNDGRSAYFRLYIPEDIEEVCTPGACHYEWEFKNIFPSCSYCDYEEWCHNVWNYYKGRGWTFNQFCNQFASRCCQKKKVCEELVCEEITIKKQPKTLKFRVLDGQGSDNFMLFAYCDEKSDSYDVWTLIYEYDADTSIAEVWKTHTLNLDYVWPQATKCKEKMMDDEQLIFRIMATGDGWQYRSTYGQLAVDWVEWE